MKVTIKSEKSKLTKYTTRKLAVSEFIVIERCVDDKLTSQEWKTQGSFSKSHSGAYNASRMFFQYYDDVSFLDSEEYLSFDLIPEPALVLDWEKFKGFNHVLCIWLSMDGNIYRIDKAKPVPLWRHFDYIGGFCNNEYDLQQVGETLKKFSFIRNVELIKIPWYNAEESTYAVEFYYKLPSKQHLAKELRKNKLFKGHYFGI